ncbi:hypothetical protein EfmAA94_08980 [Enterococcus faecium]|nr:hypothetical protein EfmAA94_08980 [Enterococcus faecium]
MIYIQAIVFVTLMIGLLIGLKENRHLTGVNGTPQNDKCFLIASKNVRC